MKKNIFPLLLLSILALQSCIGEDISEPKAVEPVFRVLNPITAIAFDQTHQLEFLFLNNFGMQVEAVSKWKSSEDSIATVTESGLLQGKSSGVATISGTATIKLIDLKKNTTKDTIITTSFEVTVSKEVIPPPPVEEEGRKVNIRTTSSYRLMGGGILKETDSGLVLEFDASYDADTRLPGLYVYLTNNLSTSSGALEVAKVTIFAGVHSYVIPGNPSINKYSHVLYYCRPFNVKVGDGSLAE